MKEIKILGRTIKIEKDPEVLDENGKPIPSTGDKIVGALKAAGALALGAGAVAAGYVIGGKKVGKEKDQVIRRLNEDKAELYQDNIEMYAQLHPVENSESDEDKEEGEIETTVF